MLPAQPLGAPGALARRLTDRREPVAGSRPLNHAKDHRGDGGGGTERLLQFAEKKTGRR
jgi:hypothetical protein